MKHTRFMMGTMKAPSHNILALDYIHPKLDISLRQAVMHIFSQTHKDWHLFVAVDSSFYGDRVEFAFRNELEDEALNMITALPLFLEHELQSTAVWDWFTDDTRLDSERYKWDKFRGVIPKYTTDNTDIQLENWEDLNDIDYDDTDNNDTQIEINPFVLDLDRIGKNSYGDDGTYKTTAYADSFKDNIPMEIDDKEEDHKDTNEASKQAHNQDTSEPNQLLPPSQSIDTSMTTSNTTSTLTKTPDRSAILTELVNDPEAINDPSILRILQKLALTLPSGPAAPKSASGAQDHES